MDSLVEMGVTSTMAKEFTLSNKIWVLLEQKLTLVTTLKKVHQAEGNPCYIQMSLMGPIYSA